MLTRKSLKVKSAAGFFLFSSVLFLILLIPAAGDESKNFYFPEVRIQIQIDKDGSFSVDEFRTYEFQGRFGWAKLWIPLRIDRQGTRYEASIENFSITDEQNIPLRTEVGQAKGRFEAKWYYSARNERRTFHITMFVNKNREILAKTSLSGLYYEFGFTMDLHRVRSSHFFQMKHQKAVDGGLVKSVLNDEYFEKLGREVLYWDGEAKAWTNHPAMANKW